MAKLYVHGTVVKTFSKTVDSQNGIPLIYTYRLMSDGKFLRKNGKGWNLVKFKNKTLTAEQFEQTLIGRGYVQT